MDTIKKGAEKSLTEQEDWLAGMEAKYKMENEKIQKYCRQNWGKLKRFIPDGTMRKSVFDKYADVMVFDFEHGLGWCPQPKVGSTTWYRSVFITSAFSQSMD